MNERQRKIMLGLADHWRNWGKAPTVNELAKLLNIAESNVGKDIWELEKLGFLRCTRTTMPVSGGYATEARLTQKAEAVLPRLREIA